MPQPIITVYSKTRCMPCKQTKDALESAGLRYTVIPITEELGNKLRDWHGYREAPVVEIGGPGERLDSWSGFRPDKIAWLTNG